MKDIVIEIDGKRHRLYNKDVACSGCKVCSLHDLCAKYRDLGICFPFLTDKQYGHFELEAK
jgi:hypothetical protein